MSYSRCDKCKRYHFDDARCPRHCYEIIHDEFGYETTVYADSMEEALEYFCQEQDSQGDYEIIGSGGLDKVKIREIGTLEWFVFNVCAEQTIEYTATMIHKENIIND